MHTVLHSHGACSHKSAVPAGRARYLPVSFLALLALVFLAVPALCKAPDKGTALVLATFGSATPQKSDPLRLIREEAARRFPDTPVFVAYTSTHVAKTLRSKGVEAKSLNQTLADLAADGYEKAAIQSLQVTPGKEFELVQATARLYPDLPKGALQTRVGLPLVGEHEDARALADVLTKMLPAERKKSDAVIFIGHGAENPVGSLAYPALHSFLRQNDPAFFVGTVEGPYDADTLLAQIREGKSGRPGTVWLVPLLTIIGDHALNDIFGESDSWKSTFQAAGFTVRTIERGLLDLPGVTTIFMDHAQKALDEVNSAAHAGIGVAAGE